MRLTESGLAVLLMDRREDFNEGERHVKKLLKLLTFNVIF